MTFSIHHQGERGGWEIAPYPHWFLLERGRTPYMAYFGLTVLGVRFLRQRNLF